jgi:hypothetical protein
MESYTHNMNKQKKTIKERVQLRIRLSKKEVFLRSDFSSLSGYDQVGRVLKQLVTSGDLVKIGQGLYTRARPNSLSGEPTIAMRGGFKRAVIAALERLNVRYSVSNTVDQYNARQSTQVPANLVLTVERGFSRSIAFNKTKVQFQYFSGSQLVAR